MSKIKTFLNLIFLLIIGTNSYAQNLLLHLPMTGNTLDISKYQNNGSIKGGVSVTEDRFGNPCSALYFNGIDGFISIPHSSSLASIHDNFSLSTWIKLDGSNTTDNLRWLTLLCKGEDAIETKTMPQYRVQIFQGNTQSTVSINTEFTEKDYDFKDHDLEFNKWYHIALTYDGKNVNFYIDGELIWNYPYNGELSKNKHDINIGRDIPGSTEFFKGSMSDLRLFDKALITSQVQNLFLNSTSFAEGNSFGHTCPTDKILTTDLSKCYASGVVENPTVQTNCLQSIITQLKGPKDGDQIELGIEKVVFKISDNNGTSKICSYNIQVLDKEAPIILPTRDTTIILSANEQSLKYAYELPMATDNCALKSIKLLNGISSNDQFPIGKTILEFEAIDESGNKSYSNYIVNILREKLEELPQVQITLPNIDTIKISTIPIEKIGEQTFEEKLEDNPKEVGSKIEIDDLYFFADKANISSKSAKQLDIVLKYLQKYPNISIEISGHTNGIPSDKYCNQLSTSRAKACYDYLILKGISKSRLQFIGQGKKQLKFPNEPENPLNQRVEITITEIK